MKIHDAWECLFPKMIEYQILCQVLLLGWLEAYVWQKWLVSSLHPSIRPLSHFCIINKATDHRQASWNNSFHFPLKVRQTRVRSVVVGKENVCYKCNASKGGAVASSDSKWSKVHTKSQAICLFFQLRMGRCRESHANLRIIVCGK